jgi:SNF2 family DNA or RNA helicase
MIPNSPHLIIASPNLLPLWEMEIKTWLGSHIECFTYTGSFKYHRNFFKDGDLYSKSQLPPYRRIVLVSTNVSSLAPSYHFFNDGFPRQ